MNGIAIIGMGCRFPGGVRDSRSYWSLLREGRCAVAEIPPERWSLEGFYDPRPGRPDRSISKWGGFLDDIRGFDPDLFGLSNREAADMDPQQRLLLQVAHEAMEDARLPRGAVAGTAAGVFVGVSNADYAYLQRYRHGSGDRQAGTGTALSIVANRLSNVFDLKGPSLCVDTACSSALVAVDSACKALADGSCDLAFAGGVNLLLDPRLFVSFSRAHMLSPRGRISAFGLGADGFVRGEGAGLVLLKRLGDALRDGDPVQAVIRATVVNQDGATGTITAPDEDAQAAMIALALKRADAAPEDIGLVEAHGTGTALGDPTEAAAIGRVLRSDKRHGPVPLGSAKAALGHLEPAAGIAGLIKAVLSLRHGECAPMAGFDKPNPDIPFDDLQLTIPARPLPLPAATLALINAFGFGGTNACAIIEGAPRAASCTVPLGP
ncbi:MAG: beta-ketoacyl synthase N-terminal-like domain-containing protein, partial [Hyphomicrobiales bacterium]